METTTKEIGLKMLDGLSEAAFALLTGDTLGGELLSAIRTLSCLPVASKWYPDSVDVFRAFKELPIDDAGVLSIRAVILGQDPYHDGSADGLAFSSRRSIPGSLRNVYKCLVKCGVLGEIPPHGNLTTWANQGVLLLNTALTVEKSSPKSHTELWRPYIGELVKVVAKRYPDAIWMCWGNDAKGMVGGIGTKHMLTWGHPSPINMFNKLDSNPKSFVNCDHFLKTPFIDWASVGITPPDPATMDYLGVDGGSRANGKPECLSSWGFCYVEKGVTPGTTQSGLVPGELHSNNRAELTAMIMGLEYAESQLSSRPLLVVCDSKYTIGVVSEWAAKWFRDGVTDKKNLDLARRALDAYARVASKRPVSFRHVNSHIVRPPVQGHEAVCWDVNDAADRANQTVLATLSKKDTGC